MCLFQLILMRRNRIHKCTLLRIGVVIIRIEPLAHAKQNVQISMVSSSIRATCSSCSAIVLPPVIQNR